MKRQRFVELTVIAEEVLTFIDKKGVSKHERCALDRVCNTMNDFDYSEDCQENRTSGEQPVFTESTGTGRSGQ